jgi:putative transposase
MLRFRHMHSLRKFAAVHFSAQNHFDSDLSLSSRQVHKPSCAAVLAKWWGHCAN